MAQVVKRQLVVFDFDWSLCDQDTDRWIFEVLAPHLRRKMKNINPTMQWTDLVAQSLREIHAEGKTREEIEHALRIIPFHPAMIRALKKLKSRTDIETTFFILSNSNSVFISTILEDRKLTHIFDAVITNPAEWDESGLLKLRRRVDPSGPQHGCEVGCSPNMCKGAELDAFLKTHEPYDRIVYVGDGHNDFCPVIRLREYVHVPALRSCTVPYLQHGIAVSLSCSCWTGDRQDMILCRTYRGLQRRIESEGGVRCQVKYWGGAWEVEEYFDQL